MNMTSNIPKVLSIAGSDCSGGAGIQADIKTITAYGAYAMSVITALTAQNTTGVAAIQEAGPEFVAQQLKAVFEDIYPDAVKIGMTSSSEIIMTIALNLRKYAAKNIVVDPVMVAESGGRLLADNAVEALIRYLLPVADLITPNLHEAGILCGERLESEEDMQRAALAISRLTPGAILIKGGHLTAEANDLLYFQGQSFWFKSPRQANPNTHGTGCTLSSAIACALAKGEPPAKAVWQAKQYINDCLAAGLNLGKGKGPLDHCCRLRKHLDK